MVDNVTLNPGVAGEDIASDDIGGVHYQIVKLTFGALDAQTIASSGTGTDDAGTQRVTLATDIALPAGTNAIGKLAANSGVDIGDVDVTSSALPTGAATAANQLADGHNVTVDNASIAVTAASLPLPAGAATAAAQLADGHNVTIDNASAGSAVNIQDGGNSITVDNSFFTTMNDSLNNIETNLGGTHVDDAAFTAATDDGVPIFAKFDDTTPDSVDEGDAGVLRMSANRNLYVTFRDAAGNERGVNVDASNQLAVAGPVTNAGTFVVQEDGASLTALQLIDNPIVAHDAAASGSTGVNMAGALATNSVEGLTQVAAADATRAIADLNGCVVTRNATTLEELVSERVSNTNGTSTAFTGAFAAGGANIHAYITSVTIHNAHASTNGYVDLRDGAAGSVIWTLPAPAGGGTTHNFNPPLKFAANTAVAYDVSAAITTVYISVNGFFAQG